MNFKTAFQYCWKAVFYLTIFGKSVIIKALPICPPLCKNHQNLFIAC